MVRIFYVPIIPLGSIRVVSEDYWFSAFKAGFPFKAQRIPLDIWMVLGVYGYCAKVFGGVIVVCAVLVWFYRL